MCPCFFALFDSSCHRASRYLFNDSSLAGELFTSAAPQDPIFWPLHGLSERFFQLIRILASYGAMTFDDAWSYEHIRSVLSDTRVVCDWTTVDKIVGNTYLLPTCSKNTTCPGHRSEDTLPFSDLDWADEGTTFTNKDFFSAISPSNTDLPYVYDRLTTWPACPNGTIVPIEWRHLLRLHASIVDEYDEAHLSN